MIRVRKGRPEDIEALKQLFSDTVRAICCQDYSPEQIEAWAAGTDDEGHWERINAEQTVLVAHNGRAIMGFATLDNDYIDMFYVHKDEQRQGVGRALYKRMLSEAAAQGQTKLMADVSLTAKPFFERMGFSIIKQEQTERGGTRLLRFKMMAHLPRS